MAEAAPGAESEATLRRRLGVPPDAEHVLVFGESSQWDPSWPLSSEAYYSRRIGPILDAVLAELEREPRRTFSLESLFFLRLYWDRRPEKRRVIRALVNAGRLAVTGTGVCGPGRRPPSTEAVLRDYLLGQEWLRQNGMTPEPRLAHLSDDFGRSPALPTILRALGFDRAGIGRIDRRSLPRPGSNAELLRKRLMSQDFVWRARDGSEVLCHWNAFTYFQGDMLAHLGVIRWMGVAFGFPWRTGSHIARRVRSLVGQLKPLSRTPYLFCPVGCDFNGPIEGLVSLLDRYNAERFSDTGVFAINASLDQHLALVDVYRDRLPVLELDPEEARPRDGLSARASRLRARDDEDGSEERGGDEEVARPSSRGAQRLAVAPPPTGSVEVASRAESFEEAERPRWLRTAEILSDAVLGGRLTATLPRPALPRWRLDGGLLEVATPHYRAVLSEARGGCFVSFRSLPDERERLDGPANDLVAYEDTTGIWRMGRDLLDARSKQTARACYLPARIHADEEGGVLVVRVDSELCGERVRRRLWFRGDSPVVRLRIDASTPRGHTIACRFPTVSRARTLTMNVPGGVIERVQSQLHDPTSWPAHSFAHLCEPMDGWGMAAFLGGPASVGVARPGALEWVALPEPSSVAGLGVRAPWNRPPGRSETGETMFDCAVWFTDGAPAQEGRLARHVHDALRDAPVGADAREFDAVDDLVTCDHPDVLVSALKPASRGAGHIARLSSEARRGDPLRATLRGSLRPIREAWLCDARERDLSSLDVIGGGVNVPLSSAIVSVRLSF